MLENSLTLFQYFRITWESTDKAGIMTYVTAWSVASWLVENDKFWHLYLTSFSSWDVQFSSHPDSCAIKWISLNNFFFLCHSVIHRFIIFRMPLNFRMTIVFQTMSNCHHLIFSLIILYQVSALSYKSNSHSARIVGGHEANQSMYYVSHFIATHLHFEKSFRWLEIRSIHSIPQSKQVRK